MANTHPLTTVQKELLSSTGVDFGIPPTSNMRERVLCDFELFYRKLGGFAPVSESKKMVCTATLRAAAEEHADKPAERRTFPLSREQMKASSELKKNNDIIVTRPDKGRATVILTQKE